MSIVSKAMLFAAEHHQHQLRKGTRIPYMSHLMNVCKTLAEQDCDDELLAAGLLHDVVEDTPVTIEEVEEKFGAYVALLVRGATELDKLEKKVIDKESSWQDRKSQTVHFLEHEATIEQLIVTAADKLDNLRAIYMDKKRIGKEIWERFSASKKQQDWYFGELSRIFIKRGKEHEVLAHLGKELGKLHLKVF
ncbi:HD domain-containing protein [Flavihumibacter sp.]|uniref:HD domain-containing protein n=1 Tax=Flavihumibacter sp. TaxID=1913981 RepID=UPI002FC6F448